MEVNRKRGKNPQKQILNFLNLGKYAKHAAEKYEKWGKIGI